jgi:beta-lactamase class A
MRRKYKSSLSFGYSNRRRKNKIKYLIITFLILIIAGGILVYTKGGFSNTIDMIFKSKNKKEIKVEKTTSQKTTEPTEINEEIIIKRDYSKLKKDIENYLKDKNGMWGVYFKNISGQETFGINDTEEYQAAGTIKIPINLMLYDKVISGEAKMDDKVVYKSEDKEGGTGRIQNSSIGTSYTLRELSKLSLVDSDNIAINMISRHFGKAKVYKAYMKEKGATYVDETKNISSPKDMGIFLNHIYTFSQDNSKLGEEFISYLKEALPNDRLQKNLPENIEVAHKAGNYVKAYHDVGIIYTNTPYILCVMSKNVNGFEENFDIIADISKKVYDYTIELEEKDEIEKEKIDRENEKKNK